MLDSGQRESRYLAQTGRVEMTPRQRRRWTRKIGHQLAAAVARRVERSKSRAAARARRKTR
jgi:hypothetical protein